MVDFFLVLMLAGAGDEIQGIKKGVLEIADALAINKADQDNIENAKRAQKEYESALSLLAPASPTWKPPVLICSAREHTGLDEIWKVVLTHREKLSGTGELEEKRKRQALDWMWALVEDGLKDRVHRHPAIKARLPVLLQNVAQGALSPTAAASEILSCLDVPPPATA
jgi:LAO/AO transport system kinase